MTWDTKSRKLEKHYKALKVRYRALFEGNKELIFRCRPDSTIIDINSFGVKLLEYTAREELIGKKFTNLYYNPRDRDYYNSLIRKSGFIKNFEIILLCKNGEKLICQETAVAIRGQDGKIAEVTGIIKDVTELVRTKMLLLKQNMEISEINKQLKQTQAKMMQQDKLASIGQLAAGIAHEINNPLGFVKSNFLVVKEYFAKIEDYIKAFEKQTLESEEFRKNRETDHKRLLAFKERFRIPLIWEDLPQLYTETFDGFERISTIINSLKNFAHADMDKQAAKYDLNQGILATLQILKNESTHIAHITTELGKIEEIFCIGSEINQVLLNIVLNALQAIKEQKRADRGHILIKTQPQNGDVECRITDDGPGIPDKILNRIFDPFFTTKEVGHGTGLGLNISYDIISKHNGTIKVESWEGKGTTFQIILPTQPEELEEIIS